MAETLTINQAGLSTVQDLGRFGRTRYGLPVNGALDQYSARVANVLTGNDEGAPLVEITALGFACTVIHGTAYGSPGYFRISFATSNAVLDDACERIARAFSILS